MNEQVTAQNEAGVHKSALSVCGVGYTRTFRYLLFILPVVALSALSHWQFVGSNIAVYFGIWLIGVCAVGLLIHSLQNASCPLGTDFRGNGICLALIQFE
jgi:hypothetical protein